MSVAERTPRQVRMDFYKQFGDFYIRGRKRPWQFEFTPSPQSNSRAEPEVRASDVGVQNPSQFAEGLRHELMSEGLKVKTSNHIARAIINGRLVVTSKAQLIEASDQYLIDHIKQFGQASLYEFRQIYPRPLKPQG